MVRRDNALAAKIEKFCDDAGTTFVRCFHCFNPSFDDPGVTNHVRIGEIQDDQFVICHPREHFVS